MSILSPVHNLQTRNWINKKKKHKPFNQFPETQGKFTMQQPQFKTIKSDMFKTQKTVRTYSNSHNHDWSSVNFLNNNPRQFSTYSNFNSHSINRNHFRINMIQNNIKLDKYNNNQKPYYKSKSLKSKNRHRVINVNKLRAPYNTTQYLMYDYSKRRGPLKDQVCPDEQEQFTNDWNLALNQTDENDPTLILLRNLFSVKKNNETQEAERNEKLIKEQDSQMLLLKKSLSELDLTNENELSNFLSTSI